MTLETVPALTKAGVTDVYVGTRGVEDALPDLVERFHSRASSGE